MRCKGKHFVFEKTLRGILPQGVLK